MHHRKRNSFDIFSTFQIVIKYIWMQQLRALIPNMDFIADIYRKNSVSSSKYYAICKRFARRSRQVMVYAYGLYSIGYIMFYMVAAYDMWRSNGVTQIAHIYIPHVHVYSTIGLVFLFIINSSVVAFCVLSVPPLDLLFFLIFGNVPLVSAIMRQQMDELTELLRLKRPRLSCDIRFIKRHFLHYIRIHHKYNE